jgi:RNA polymerase sigma factor (sigma-70 family)
MAIPGRIERLSAKRGVDWTPTEVGMIKEWLCQRPQLQTAWYYAARYLGAGATEQDIEDAVSSVFSLFEPARRSYKPEGPKPSFYHYLLHVCFKHNCILAGKRMRQRINRETSLEYDLENQVLIIDTPDQGITGDPDRVAQGRAFARELTAFLNTASLPEKQKTVFVLRYLEDLSYEQIAEITGSPMGSIKGWLSRATLAARHYLKERGWSECHRDKK